MSSNSDYRVKNKQNLTAQGEYWLFDNLAKCYWAPVVGPLPKGNENLFKTQIVLWNLGNMEMTHNFQIFQIKKTPATR